MKFALNSLVLEILSFWLGFTVSDPSFKFNKMSENMLFYHFDDFQHLATIEHKRMQKNIDI